MPGRYDPYDDGLGRSRNLPGPIGRRAERAERAERGGHDRQVPPDEPDRRLRLPSHPLRRDEQDYSRGQPLEGDSAQDARDARSSARRPPTSRPLYGQDGRAHASQAPYGSHASYERDDVSDRRPRGSGDHEEYYDDNNERAPGRGFVSSSSPERFQRRDRRAASRSAADWDDRADGWDTGDTGEWDRWDDERNDGWAASHDRRQNERNGARNDFAPPRRARHGAAGTLTGWRETTRQWAVTQQKRLFGSHRRLAIILLVLLAVSLFGGVPTTVFAFAQYGLVKDGIAHIKNVQTDAKAVQKNPFDTNTIAAMRGELVAAHNDFTQLSSRLGLIPGALDVVPVAGSKLAGAQRLMPIAVEGTQAGITACDALTILASALKNPLDPSAKGLTPQETTQLAGDVDQLVGTFNQLVPQINALQPSDLSLDPRLGPAIATFKTDLPKIAQIVQGAQAFAHLAPQLLGVGKPANYLVEVLDSTELRPGGGFIGNEGILTLNGGRMSDLKIQDVDLLDNDVKHGNLATPLPSQYSWLSSIFVGEVRWGFRDSNLDADFPTSAQNGETLYAKEVQFTGQTPAQLQGVVAITPWLIQNAMKITGNIEVTDYPTPGHTEVVTPQNLIDKIHYYALGTYQGPDTQYDPRCGSSLRKCFTGLLFKAFMAKMKQSLSGNFGKFGQLFTDSLHTKDIQIYLNPTSAEQVLHQFSLDSTVAAPTTGDSLFEVDANIGGSKTNYFLTYNTADQVTLDAAGNATHHLVFTYKWPYNPQSLVYDFAAGNNYRYHSYSRLYLPPSAAIKGQSGWADPGTSKGTVFGRKELNGTTYVYYNNSLTVTFDYTVPHAATHDASGWHYDLLWQRQAGVTWQMSEQVRLPSCATLAGTPVGFTTTSGKTVSVKEPLENDVHFAVDYTGC